MRGEAEGGRSLGASFECGEKPCLCWKNATMVLGENSAEIRGALPLMRSGEARAGEVASVEVKSASEESLQPVTKKTAASDVKIC